MEQNRSNWKWVGIVFLTLIAIFFIWNFLFDKTFIKNRDSLGTTIVAFGDSLIRGVGSTEGNDFVSFLSHKINRPIINLGVSGDTTATALQRIDEVIKQDPKIVIVLLGGNDYLRKVPINETFDNLDKIVQKIHDSGSMVLLLGVRGGLLLDTHDDNFRDFAKSHDVAFVPNVLDGLIGNKELMSDSIHPNDKGYAIIADKVEKILKELVQSN